ncbi:MAG: hypothetical protein UHJ41_06630, partial [Bacteroidaceae bacterium]|nr:hypothetical protein [Bacteroidaceae bacterium]
VTLRAIAITVTAVLIIGEFVSPAFFFVNHCYIYNLIISFYHLPFLWGEIVFFFSLVFVMGIYYMPV